jgi:protocatechuate 3,4-dioxygenase, beta subunit
MKRIFQFGLFSILLNNFISCSDQTKKNNNQQITSSAQEKKIVGGGCDGCEIMFAGMPINIKSTDTSAGWTEKGQKLLITGTVYQIDGTTPAPNVIIYYWQTDHNGYYSPKIGMHEKAKRHGHIRGWVKTNQEGKFEIYTIRPAPYPNENIPAHIHTSIKEPNIETEYYIDEFVFEDDKLLTDEKRKALKNRGGSGILRVLSSGNLQIAKHNIILGLHIPNYPETNKVIGRTFMKS